ncbi:hypothetical protein DMB66_08385 [Actinoplanes sp. ATCC 53533]|uniref:VHL beta domain-containing protein n=1 Tax=Actinoplanes sp. ATCC 53533 TaxID=1288362 RepID=UPI000F79690D|nr:hypothetical protein [Actinoplanes sp. ATCC 53533]RSM70727.1 hypothetical protein DMB66_08385 [Actinoplanes sp. ATCC 53533]
MTLPPPPDFVPAYAPPRRGSRLPWVLGGVAVLAALLCLAGAGVATVWLLRTGEENQPGSAPRVSSETARADADAATWPELTALPVTTEPTLRSGGNGTPTQVAFVNDTRQVVTVSWIDQDGSRVTYQTLRPGETYTQPTYVGHPWVVAAVDGQALAVFQPAPAPGRAVVR